MAKKASSAKIDDKSVLDPKKEASSSVVKSTKKAAKKTSAKKTATPTSSKKKKSAVGSSALSVDVQSSGGAEKAAKSARKTVAKKSAAKKATSSKSAEKKTAAKKTVKKSAIKKAAAPKASSRKSAKAVRSSVQSAVNLEDVIQVPDDNFEAVSIPASRDKGSIVPTQRNTTRSSVINGNQFVRQTRDARPLEKAIVPAPEVHYEEPQEELPVKYDDTTVSCLIKDSEWLFVYWNMSAEAWERYHGFAGEATLCLRLIRIPAGDPEVAFEDVSVSDISDSWYLYVPKPGREYCVELGVKNQNGEFTALARSNSVFVPTLEVASEMIDEVAGNDIEAYRQILKLSGAGTLLDNISSGSFSAELVRRLSMTPSSFSGSVFSGSFVSSTFASETMAARTSSLIEGEDRKFWLVVDAEVIVYGATEPDARVKFMGKEIRLNPDGTFGIRMALPDGKIEFPVEATSADGEETRRVSPVVTRKTDDK